MVENSRVVVAMSGGVDSSVTAALLDKEGYEVIGIMLRLWSEPRFGDENKCCAPDSVIHARRVANLIGIPFYVIDARRKFQKNVVEYFINGYSQGITPNPCLVCNQLIRWGFLLDEIKKFDAQYLATGHYARIEQSSNGKIKLLKALDKKKDQSYVIYMLDQGQLSTTLFPLGIHKKEEVRNLAREFSLPVFDRPESQDLCFIGNDSYQNFLRRNASHLEKCGDIYSIEGNLIGKHAGVAFYTIGQRKGLGVHSSQPLYVINKNASTNTIIVGGNEARRKSKFNVSNINWISGKLPDVLNEFSVKIRYRSAEIPCRIFPTSENQIEIHLNEPTNDITPGQAAVIYEGDVCLGGGIISG
jgi:tRNA-specific 2-thiouridylase